MCDLNSETAIDALVALGIPLALQTGLSSIDNLLQNDLQFGEMSEIVGGSSAGKTQLCYAIVANTLLHTKYNVAWLDSNGSFRSHRLVEFINGRGIYDTDVVNSLLDRICVARVSDQTQLLDALEFIDEKMETNNFRLIVIDSIFEMFDDRQLVENMTRSAVFNSILCRIGILTDIGCTVLVTTSMPKAKNEKNDLNKAWTRQMKSRILVKESDGLRTLHNLNVWVLFLLSAILWKFLHKN